YSRAPTGAAAVSSPVGLPGQLAEHVLETELARMHAHAVFFTKNARQPLAPGGVVEVQALAPRLPVRVVLHIAVALGMARDEGGRRIAVQQRAARDDGDTVADLLDLLHVVRGQEHGGA